MNAVLAGPVGVKLRRTQAGQMSSGLALKADIAQYGLHVSKVPMRRYSMTSSVRAISVGGISAPSVLAETSQQDLPRRL